MKKKAIIFLSVTAVIVAAAIIITAILLKPSPAPTPDSGSQNPAPLDITQGYTDYSDSLMVPEDYIFQSAASLTGKVIYPNFFVRNDTLSYSLVGQLPLNDINFTDIGNLYSVELTEENFDSLFPEGKWAENINAEVLRTGVITAKRADLTLGAMDTQIPLGKNYYYLLTTSDSVLLCHFSDNTIQDVIKMKIMNEEINTSFNATVVQIADTDEEYPAIVVEPAEGTPERQDATLIRIDPKTAFYESDLRFEVGDEVLVKYDGALSTIHPTDPKVVTLLFGIYKENQ